MRGFAYLSFQSNPNSLCNDFRMMFGFVSSPIEIPPILSSPTESTADTDKDGCM